MESFWNWYVDDSGGTWIIGALAAIGAVLAILRTRKHPPKVVVEEVEEIRLLDIHPAQQGRLKVFIASDNGDIPIQNLVQKKLIIYNPGDQAIDGPLTLKFFFATDPKNKFAIIDPGLYEMSVNLPDNSPPQTVKPHIEERLAYFELILPYLSLPDIFFARAFQRQSGGSVRRDNPCRRVEKADSLSSWAEVALWNRPCQVEYTSILGLDSPRNPSFTKHVR